VRGARANAGGMVRPLRPLLVLWAAVALALMVTPACGSQTRAVDTCRTLEEARCDQGAKCPNLLAGGDVDSCKRFYDVQCGRGVADPVKEPSRTELDACIRAIQSSCAIAAAPETAAECAFLLQNQPIVDSGTPDGDATDAADAADSAVAPDTTDSAVAPDTTDSAVAPDTTDAAVAPDTTDAPAG
jgi:hypothetical protein